MSNFYSDPYYCNGTVKKQLASLGYTNVINECKDFYSLIENDNGNELLHYYYYFDNYLKNKTNVRCTVPNYDVLITNPPFSGDHIERIFDYCVNKQSKPFFILAPK